MHYLKKPHALNSNRGNKKFAHEGKMYYRGTNLSGPMKERFQQNAISELLLVARAELGFGSVVFQEERIEEEISLGGLF